MDGPAKKAELKSRSTKVRVNAKRAGIEEKNPEYYKKRISNRLTKLNNRLISATRRKERIEHYTEFICNKARSLLENADDNREYIKGAKDEVEKN